MPLFSASLEKCTWPPGPELRQAGATGGDSATTQCGDGRGTPSLHNPFNRIRQAEKDRTDVP